ncbi:MAG: SdpI family protein [Candidatus Paceibacterota bacterium]
MKIKKSEVTMFLIVLLSFLVGAYFYPQMPERIASHWDYRGEVNGEMNRFWGTFLMPMISLLMLALFMIIPRIDPLKENIAQFRKYFDNFIVLIASFLFYIYILTIMWNLGIKINIIEFMSPALGILFYYCGILIENSKMNWSIGIRTPWTLSSEKVWDKTHALGGKLFKIVGIISLFGTFFPDFAIALILIPIILVTVYIFLYSYLEYRKEIVR